MARKYQTVVYKDYQLAIWDNCSAELQTNGERFRVIYDDTVWKDNTGSCRTFTRYMSLEDGRKVMEAYAQAMVEMNSDDPHGHTPLEVLMEQLGDNYAPNDVPVPTYTR